MKLETFFEEFDLFADAPDAVAKMRELVLRLALQGKVSELEDGDVSVAQLIQLIETERKTNKGKTHPEVERGTISDPVPEHWTWIRFGNIANHNAGKTLDQKRNTGAPRDYITTSNLYWGRFELRQLRKMLIRDEEMERCTARKGDLLICEGGEAGRAAVWPFDNEVAFQNHVHRARFYAEVNPYYVFRVFEKLNYTGEINDFRKGVGISNMSGKALASIPIPLPPLAEQKRIVAKVDELMALCDRLEAQQQERDTQQAALARASLARFATAPTPANLNFLFHSSYHIPPADLRKSILTLAVQGKLVPQDSNDEPAEELIERIGSLRTAAKAKVHDDVCPYEVPYNIPQSWKWVRLGNICLSSDSGWSPQCLPEQRTGTEWGVLKVSAVSWGIFKPEENKALPPGKEPRPGCEVKPGDFLLSRANTEELVARSVVVVKTPPHLMMSDKIVRFTFPDEIDRDYINLANSSDPARSHYAKNSSGTSSSMKNVGRGVMCALPIPLPPLAEQRRIVAKVDQLMALVDELETQLTESRATAKHLLEALVAELTATQN